MLNCIRLHYSITAFILSSIFQHTAVFKELYCLRFNPVLVFLLYASSVNKGMFVYGKAHGAHNF